MLVIGHMRVIFVLSSLLNAADDYDHFILSLKRALVYLFSHEVFVLHSSKPFHAMRQQFKGVGRGKNLFSISSCISCRASVQLASSRLSLFFIS